MPTLITVEEVYPVSFLPFPETRHLRKVSSLQLAVRGRCNPPGPVENRDCLKIFDCFQRVIQDSVHPHLVPLIMVQPEGGQTQSQLSAVGHQRQSLKILGHPGFNTMVLNGCHRFQLVEDALR